MIATRVCNRHQLIPWSSVSFAMDTGTPVFVTAFNDPFCLLAVLRILCCTAQLQLSSSPSGLQDCIVLICRPVKVLKSDVDPTI